MESKTILIVDDGGYLRKNKGDFGQKWIKF
jgi:hypothetical protein